MIFASDIDRTIVFSHRFLNKDIDKESLTCVEKITDKEISYMTKNALDKMMEISQIVHIVPVTMRSLSEYQRLLFSEELEYAIVCNGGTILRDNKPLKEWEKQINKVKPKNYKDIIAFLQEYNRFFKKDIRIVDDVYFFASIKEDLAKEKEKIKANIETTLTSFKEWSVALNSNKIYIYPTEINKANALSFLKKYIEKEEYKKSSLITAGDSPVDLPMLQLGNQRIIPDGSAILKEDLSKVPYLRIKPGFKGTEELFNIVNKLNLIM